LDEDSLKNFALHGEEAEGGEKKSKKKKRREL
jgi:hypothetical protein